MARNGCGLIEKQHPNLQWEIIARFEPFYGIVAELPPPNPATVLHETADKESSITRLAELFLESERMKADASFQDRCGVAGAPENRALVALNVEIFKLRRILKYQHAWLSPQFTNHWAI
jgi:hypothetical protein